MSEAMFVPPKSYEEFVHRYPRYIQTFLFAHGMVRTQQEAEEEEAALAAALVLPARSRYRKMGYTTYIETFDPARIGGNCSEALWRSWLNRILKGKLFSIRKLVRADHSGCRSASGVERLKRRKSDVLDLPYNREINHADAAASGNPDASIRLREFMEFCGDEDPEAAALVRAYDLTGKWTRAAEELSLDRYAKQRTRDRLTVLADRFRAMEDSRNPSTEGIK